MGVERIPEIAQRPAVLAQSLLPGTGLVGRLQSETALFEIEFSFNTFSRYRPNSVIDCAPGQDGGDDCAHFGAAPTAAAAPGNSRCHLAGGCLWGGTATAAAAAGVSQSGGQAGRGFLVQVRADVGCYRPLLATALLQERFGGVSEFCAFATNLAGLHSSGQVHAYLSCLTAARHWAVGAFPIKFPIKIPFHLQGLGRHAGGQPHAHSWAVALGAGVPLEPEGAISLPMFVAPDPEVS